MSGIVFARIPLDVMAMTDISANAKLLYARLLLYMGEQGMAWPAQATLASDLGISVRSVKRSVAELAIAGMIEKEQSSIYATNRYRLAGMPDFGEALGANSGTPPGTKSGPHMGTKSGPHKRIIEKKKEKRSAQRGTRIEETWRPDPECYRRQVERTDEAFVERTLEYFVNYWLSAAGQRGVKLDWDRTFHNWITTEIDRGRYKPRRVSAHAPSAEATDRRRAGLADALKRRMESAGSGGTFH
jgi:hypothetical protein